MRSKISGFSITELTMGIAVMGIVGLAGAKMYKELEVGSETTEKQFLITEFKQRVRTTINCQNTLNQDHSISNLCGGKIYKKNNTAFLNNNFVSTGMESCSTSDGSVDPFQVGYYSINGSVDFAVREVRPDGTLVVWARSNPDWVSKKPYRRPFIIAEEGIFSDSPIICSNSRDLGEEENFNLCNSDKKITSETISFSIPRRNNGCAWNVNGNGARDSGVPAARSEQVVSVSMPSEARIICGISLGTLTGEVEYDDSLIITINNLIVAANGFVESRLENQLEKNENGLYVYDFANLINRGYDRDRSLILPNIDAVMPRSEHSETISLDISSQWFRDAGFLSGEQESSTLNFGAIVTGNKQSSDCKHTGLDFELTVDYIR